VILIIDFSTLSMQPNVSGASTLDEKLKFAGVCVARCEWLARSDIDSSSLTLANTSDKDRRALFKRRNHHQIFDYLVEKEKSPNDFFFIRHVLVDLFARLSPLFTEILLWTDNEAKSFKSKFIQTFLCEAQQQMPNTRLSHSMWSPYHAQSMADSHVGKIRDALRGKLHRWEAAIRSSALSRTPTVPSLQHSFASFDDVKAAIEEAVPRTTVFRPDINRTASLKPNVKSFSVIQTKHHFTYPQAGMVWMHQTNQDQHPTKEWIQYLSKKT
jgi:hypothetical protein